MKRYLRAGMLVIAILFLTACSGGGKNTDVELRIGIEGGIGTLDWHKSTNIYEKNVYSTVMEGLTRSDAMGRISPGIAEKWTVSKDGRVWTFYLRDAKWIDGVPVTARQFEDGVKYALNPQKPTGYYSYMLYDIKGANEYARKGGSANKVAVKSIGDKKLQITLNNPVTYFDYLTSMPIFSPLRSDKVKEFADKYGQGTDYAISNGPFTIESISENKDIMLRKNPTYWNAENVSLNTVKIKVVNNANEAFKQFLEGETDVTLFITEEQKDQVMATGRGTVNQYAAGSVWGLLFNCDDSVLKNKNIRKALTYAINREELTENVINQPWKPLMALVPKDVIPDAQMKGYFRDAKPAYFTDNNVDEARKLFKKGMKELQITSFPKLVLIANDNDDVVKCVNAVKRMWKDNLGIEISIKNMKPTERIEVQRKGDYDISFVGWGIDYPDPMTILEMFETTSETNTSRYYNLAYDETIKKAKMTANRQKKYDILHKAEDILMSDMPMCPLYIRYIDYAVISDLKGYSKGPFSPYLNIINAKMK